VAAGAPEAGAELWLCAEKVIAVDSESSTAQFLKNLMGHLKYGGDKFATAFRSACSTGESRRRTIYPDPIGRIVSERYSQ
jgi:hypothetical protein